MTTAETTVKNAFFNSKPESKTPNPRKADDQSKVQSFGDVLGKTAQKFEAPKQTTAQAITSSEKTQTQQPDKKNFDESKNTNVVKDTSEQDTSVKDTTSETVDTSTEPVETVTEEITDTAQTTEPMEEASVDEMTDRKSVV